MIPTFNQFLNESKLFNNTTKINDVYSSGDILTYIKSIHYNEDDFSDGDIVERVNKYSNYVVKEVPMNKIILDNYSLEQDWVDDYINQYEKSKSYPLIVVSPKNGKYDIIDGNHRANALSQVGLKKIITLVGKK